MQAACYDCENCHSDSVTFIFPHWHFWYHFLNGLQEFVALLQTYLSSHSRKPRKAGSASISSEPPCFPQKAAQSKKAAAYSAQPLTAKPHPSQQLQPPMPHTHSQHPAVRADKTHRTNQLQAPSIGAPLVMVLRPSVALRLCLKMKLKTHPAFRAKTHPTACQTTATQLSPGLHFVPCLATVLLGCSTRASKTLMMLLAAKAMLPLCALHNQLLGNATSTPMMMRTTLLQRWF